MSKRKADAISYDKKIAILEEFVKKDKKKYHFLENELSLYKSSKDQWFSFFDNHYYPFSVVWTESNEKCLDSFHVRVELSMKNDSFYTPCVQEGVTRNGVFWLKCFKPHVKGTMVLKVTSSSDEVEPLFQEIKVIEDQKKDSKSSAKKEKGNRSSTSHKSSAQIVEDSSEDEPFDDGYRSKQQVLLDSSSIGAGARHSSQQSLQFFQTVRNLPQFLPIHVRNRLDIPLISGACDPLSSSTTNQNFKFGTNGSVKIPQSLLSCLYNDKTVVSPSVIACLQAMFGVLGSGEGRLDEKALTKKEKKTLESGFQQFMTPSVNEILSQLEIRNSSQNLSEIADFLRVLFTKILFSHVLYDEERDLFRRYLDAFSRDGGNRRNSSSNTSLITDVDMLEHLGPYYFLRFLVVVLMNLSEDSEVLNCSSTRKDFPSNKQVHELEKFIDNSLKYLDEHFSAFFA